MSSKDPDGAKSEMAQRMRRIRVLFSGEEHGSARLFAQRLEIAENRWYNYENGFPVSLDVARKLVTRLPGLTLDYIYLGNLAGLTVDLAHRLDELERKRA